MRPLPALNSETGIITFEEAIAHYVYEVIKQVSWPESSPIESYKIGIYTDDELKIDAFHQQQSFRTVKNRKSSIHVIENLESPLEHYHVIYVDQDNRGDLKQIFELFSDSLIINLGRVDKDEQMVSLIKGYSTISITLNVEKLNQHNLQASLHLLTLAADREDLSLQLSKREAYLKDLYQQVQDKEQQLLTLNDELEEKDAALSAQKQLLAEQAGELEASLSQLNEFNLQITEAERLIKDNRQEMVDNKRVLDQQQQTLLEKQKAFLAQQQKMTQLEADIMKNQKILLQQQDDILIKQNELAEQERVISFQRHGLYGVASIAVIFLIMSFFLMRISLMHKRANKELEKLNSRLYELATVDSLTKIFNRRHFFETTEKYMAYARRQNDQAAVLMIDIDHFKSINDRFGHAVGDKAILLVADILRSSLREYDLVGRLGGEEYGMYLANCSKEDALLIAERLRQKIAESSIRNLKSEEPITFTVSIGVTMFNGDDQHIEALLIKADQALYRAKENGRNRVEE